MTDRELIDRTLRADREAYGELVRRYQDRLYSAMVYVTNCHMEAEDVVQEAFIHAYQKLYTFKHNSEFYTWLYRIAVRCAITRKRRARVGTTHLDPEVLADQASTRDDPEQPLQRKEAVQRLRSAMADLDEQHRTVLLLREFEGFDGPTVAGILGIPEGTVRSRLHRARRQLRQRLEGSAALLS